MVITRSQTRRKRHSTVSKTLQLPFDIIFDILSTLPVKSLLKFKSVSKTWYNLIKNTNFVKQHLARSKRNPNPTFSAILSTVSARNMGKQIFRVHLIDALDRPINLDMPFVSDRIEVLGICDGLVCAVLHNKNSLCFAICNPLTGEFRLVPSMDEDCTYLQMSNEGKNRCFFGFGLNGDKGYELFKLGYDSSPERILECDFYSLTTNAWRKIEVEETDFEGNFYSSPEQLESHWKNRTPYEMMPVFLRGFFYWAATNFDYGYVVYFDVERAVFGELLCPDECSDYHWILRDLKAKLALVIYHENHDAFDIYVLNEEEGSWTKIFEIEEVYGIAEVRYGSMVTVLGCTGSGELVVDDYNYKTSKMLYDMDTNDVEALPYANVSENREVFLYTESLVSINASDDEFDSN